MIFPIDCLFIGQNYEVIEVVEDLKPWKVGRKVSNALGVIELPKGTIERTNKTFPFSIAITVGSVMTLWYMYPNL